jgi:hypothetical protein
MILFLLTDAVPPFLLICLLIMCYLAGYELWKEDLQSSGKLVGSVRVPAEHLGLCDLLDLASDPADQRTGRVGSSLLLLLRRTSWRRTS